VRDVVDLIWEAVRMRRLKAALMTAGARDGMESVLLGLGQRGALALAGGWAARELTASDQADAILESAGLDMDHVMAQTLRRHIDVIERIDRMAAAAEARRAATLHEIARYRARFAATLADAADAAIADAEFAVVAGPGTPAAAAEGAAQEAAEAAE
jgi:hypothetical protein